MDPFWNVYPITFKFLSLNINFKKNPRFLWLQKIQGFYDYKFQMIKLKQTKKKLMAFRVLYS